MNVFLLTVSQHRRVYGHISAVRSSVTVNYIHTHTHWYQISGSHSYGFQSRFQWFAWKRSDWCRVEIDQSGVGRLDSSCCSLRWSLEFKRGQSASVLAHVYFLVHAGCSLTLFSPRESCIYSRSRITAVCLVRWVSYVTDLSLISLI